MLAWVKRCICYVKDMEDLLVMILPPLVLLLMSLGCLVLFWFHFFSHIRFTSWNVLRCLDICTRKFGQNNKGKKNPIKIWNSWIFSLYFFPQSFKSKSCCCSGYVGTKLAVAVPHRLCSPRTCAAESPSWQPAPCCLSEMWPEWGHRLHSWGPR